MLAAVSSVGPHDGSARPGGERLAPLTAAAAVAALLFLIAVVAAATGGGRSVVRQEVTGDTPQLLKDLVYTLVVLFGAALLIGTIVAIASARNIQLPRRPDGGRLWLRVALILMALAAATLFARIYRPQPQETEEGAVARKKPAQPPAAVRARKSDPPEFRWELVVALAAAGAAGAAVYALRRRSDVQPEGGDLDDTAEVLSSALEDAIDDLRAERDARRAVIAAYARLEATLARHGVPRRPWEAPLEYLSRILLELEVRPEAVLDLTELFEQAKFSRRAIDAAMKEEAIGALAAVRDDLREAA